MTFRLTISVFICCIFIVYIIFTWLRHGGRCQLVVKLYLSCIEHYIMRVMYEFELWATGDWRENVRKESHGSKPAFTIGGERPCEQGNISSLFCLHVIYTLYFLELTSDIIVTSSATLTWSLSLWLSQLVPMYSVYGVPASWENQIFLANIV